jgi:peroxiredoxin
MPMLLPGDQSPDMEIQLPRGESISLPDDVSDSWAYVLFYRGGW